MMKKILGIIVLGLLISNQGITKQLSKSPFIPDDVYEQFNKLPKDHKIKICGFDDDFLNWSLIDKDLPSKIKGYNSRMDNWREVEGQYGRDVAIEYGKAITYSMVTEDENIKERLFDKLYQWAKSKRLTETKQCYTNKGDQFVSDDCEGEWSDPDGQNLAPIKDSTVTVEIVLGLNYSYNLFFADYKVDDPRHDTIKDWFSFFYKRVTPARTFFWGNSIGWYMPNIFIQHQGNKKYTKSVKKMVKGANKWMLNDGSIKNRTTRGNRALWYHHNGLGEAFMVMEMAYAANVKLPKNFEKKLLLAVDLFHKAYLDHSYITKWARKGHNSQFDENNPDYQKFNTNLDSIDFDAWWFHVMQYRYPDHPTSKLLKKELTSKARSLKSDGIVGFGIGCIYNAIANKNQKPEQIEDASKLSIFEIKGETFNLKLDKVDFIEIRPFKLERDKKYLQPYQLHKADIHGSLRARSDNTKKINFGTLVFKQDGTLQRLTINVGDRSVNLFKQHSDSLQKKCGSELMNEWGWLSFISETTNFEEASEQQCHYDYFKEANDKEAWELFQAFLGGTNSILDYLETNVEL